MLSLLRRRRLPAVTVVSPPPVPESSRRAAMRAIARRHDSDHESVRIDAANAIVRLARGRDEATRAYARGVVDGLLREHRGREHQHRSPRAARN